MSDFDQADPSRTTVGGHERLTTLSLVDEASITRRAPLYDPAKGIANHKAFLRYVRQAYEGATPQTFVDAGLGEPTGKQDLENPVWANYVNQYMAPGALDTDSTMALKPAEGMSKADLMLIDMENRLTAAKSGVRINRWGGARVVDIRNAADALAMHTLREDFKQHVRTSGAEAAILDAEDIEKFFRESLGDSRLLSPKRIESNFPLDYTSFEHAGESTRELMASAMGIDPATLADPSRARLAQSIDDALKDLGIETSAPAVEAKSGQSLSQALASATPEQLANVIAVLETEGASINQKHYAPKMKRVMLTRSYNTFMRDTMDRILDVQQQRRYERSMDERESATVYQQKKNIPESHLTAAERSVFATTGDFAHVEIDESVELELMAKIEQEWNVLRAALPHSPVKADLRFRKTGRHNATGIYHPSLNNIAVDPRTPSSFVHEYFHHLDYTLGADSDTKQLSLSEDFSDLLHGVQRNMRADGGIEKKKMDYYTTPTEVFARGAELVCYWSGLATSLNGDAAKYDSAVFRAYEPYRERLIAWYNKRLGLDIAHEKAVTPPGRPVLGELHKPQGGPSTAPVKPTISAPVRGGMGA